MLERRNQRQKLRALLIHAHIGSDNAGGRACRILVEEFANRNIETVTVLVRCRCEVDDRGGRRGPRDADRLVDARRGRQGRMAMRPRST